MDEWSGMKFVEYINVNGEKDGPSWNCQFIKDEHMRKKTKRNLRKELDSRKLLIK